MTAAGHEDQIRHRRAWAEPHGGTLPLAVLTPGAFANDADPEFVGLRQQHHPDHGPLTPYQGQVNGVFPRALQKILGAIEGIENPKPLGRHGLAFRELVLGRLFTEQGPVGLWERS